MPGQERLAHLPGGPVASSAGLADRAAWQTQLTAARDALAASLDEHGGARSAAFRATATLRDARERFLIVYNRVAKRLIAAILADTGRDDEYRLFFRDLQVAEDQPGTGEAAEPIEPADPDKPADPGTP